MRFSFKPLRAVSLALALAACAKQQPLPVANFVGIPDTACAAVTAVPGEINCSLAVATGQQVILDGSSSVDPADPTGASLTYDWSFVSLPAGSRAKLETPHNAKTRFTADVPASVTLYVVALVVKNQYFVSVPRLLTITADDCGSNVPQINSIGALPASINVATPVLLTPAVDDKDNDATCQAVLGNHKQTEKYHWVLTLLPPGSKAHLLDPSAEKAAFDPDVAGTYTATLTVTDSTGRSSDAPQVDPKPPYTCIGQGCINVQVAACGGAAPGINSISSSPASPNLAQPTQLTADVTDADNNSGCALKQTLSYAWKNVALPTGSSARLNDAAAVNPSFTPDVPGDYAFTLVVTDSTGRPSAPLPFTVTVKDCGGAPPTPIVQFTPTSAGIGQPVSLKVTPQDADAACGISETFSYAWSLVSVPGGSRAQIVGTGAAAASLIPDAGGDWAINVTITDSRGSSASALTHLAVAGCGNNPPSVDSLTGLPLTPLVGQNVHVTAQVSDADSSCAGFDPAQTFAWTITLRPAGSATALKDPVARAADFVPDAIGHYQLSLVVKDATGLASAPGLFDVQTSTCGKSAPQIVSVGSSNPSPDPGTPFTLFAQTLDPDNGVTCNLNQAVSLQWTVSSRPAASSATLSNPASATPSFTADAPGSYQFSVVATDSTGSSSPPSFLTLNTTSCGTAIPTVTVVPASATVQPFQTVNLSATPFDANSSCGLSQTFTYAWKIVSAPSGTGAMISNPGAAAPTFAPDVGGTYLISVTVADSLGHVSPAALVTVTAASCDTLPPAAGAIASSAASLGLPVTLSAPAAKANACGAGTALLYGWSLSAPSGSRAMLDNPAAAAPRFTPDVAGLYQAGLVVRDSHGLASTQAVLNLNVAPCGTSNLSWNNAPELTPVFNEPGFAATLTGGVWSGAFVGTSVAMSAGFIDPPGCGIAVVQPFTYQWALVSQPAGSTAHLDAANVAMPGFVPDLPGDYQIAARVGDATGAVLPTRFATLHIPSCGSTLPTAGIGALTTTLNTNQVPPLQLTASASDSDSSGCPARFTPGPTFQFAWSVSPAGAALTSSTGSTTGFTANAPGTYIVSLVATATNGLQSLPATLALSVGTCGSHSPSIAQVTTKVGGIATSRPLVGQSVTVTAVATDADIGFCGDTIASYSWTLSSAPAGSSACTPASPCTTTFASDTFTPDVAGTYQFTVFATDSTGLESPPYTVAVQTAICAPSVGSITPSPASPATNQLITLTATTPADTCVQPAAPALAYAWRIVSAPHGSTAMLSSSTGLSTGFKGDLAGVYQFEVIATDQAGFTSAPTSLQLSIGTCGSTAPGLAAIAARLNGTLVSSGGFNAGDRLVLSSALTDNNGSCGALTQPFSWQWALLSRPAGSAAAVVQTDATPVFVPDLPGAYQFSAQAIDALGNASSAVFATFATSSCGINPVTASIAPPGPATVNSPLALTATIDDLDNHIASCPASFAVALGQRWSILTAPAGATATLTSTSAASTSFQGNLPGNYVVGLVGTASNGLSSALAAVSISNTSCGGNPPSVISVSSNFSRPPVGTSTEILTANVFDLDNVAGASCAVSQGQTFTYAWRAVSLPAGASVDTSTTGSQLSFIPGVAGTYVFEVVATDHPTGFSSQPFRTSIATAGCGPALGAIAGSGSSVGTPVGVSVSVTDNCVATTVAPAYFWSLASRPLTSNAFFNNPASVSNSFTPDVTGTYDVQVTVTDAGGFSSSTDKLISVGTGCGTPPSASITAHAFFGGVEVFTPFDRDDAVSLSASASGGGCGATAPTYSYEWSIGARPAASTAQLASSDAAATSLTLDVPSGTWQVVLIVRDQLGNASTPQFATLTSSNCGGRPPVIAGLPSTLSLNTFQPQTLSITQPQANPDTAGPACPARFIAAALPAAYVWSLVSRPAGAPAPAFSASGPNASFAAHFPGAYRVQAIATGHDGAASAPFFVDITAAQCGYNAPAIGAFAATQSSPGAGSSGPTYSARVDMAISAGVTDADNAPGACGTTPAQGEFQQWLLTSAPAGSIAQLTGANTASPHLVPDKAGGYTVQLIASDSTGLSSSASHTFTVSACGTQAPTAGALSASQPLSLATTLHTPTKLAVGLPVILDAPTVTDPDHNSCAPAFAAATALWTLQPAPGSQARLSSATTLTPSFVPDALGVYTLTLTLTNATGVSSTSSPLLIDVECGAAPPAVSGFTATQTLPSLNTNAGTVANFQIKRGGTVQNADVPLYPSVPIVLSAAVDEGDAATCPAVEKSFAYSWTLASAPAGSTAAILSPASQTPSLVADLAGEYDVQLTVTDSTGLSSTTNFGATAPLVAGLCGIQAPQARVDVVQPIAATSVSRMSVPVGSMVQLNALQSHDADNDQLLLTSADTPAGGATTESGCGLSETLTTHWTVTEAPAALQPFTLAQPDLPNPSFTASVAGNFGLTLAVSDGARTGTTPISVHARGIGTSTVVATPANIDGLYIVSTVGGSHGANITTTVLDTDGNPLAAVPVTLSVTAGPTGNTLTPPSGTTDANGQFVAVLTSTKAGGTATKNGETKTVRANSGAAVLGSASVTFDPDVVDHIDWFVQPCDTPTGSIVKCGAVFPEVDGYDQFGNVRTAYTSTVTLTVQSEPSGATVSGTFSQPAGTAFNDLSGDTNGPYQLLATVPQHFPGPSPVTTGPSPNFGVFSAVFHGEPAPALAPVFSSSTATVPNQILLAWAGSQNGAGHTDKTILQYHVFRAPGAVTLITGTFTDIAVVPSTGGSPSAGTGCSNYTSCGYVDISAPLTDGTEFTYYVEADNNGIAVGSCTSLICSAPSAPLTQQFTMPGVAQNVTTSAPAQTTIRVSWTAPATGFVSTYDVLRASTLTGSDTQIGSCTGLSNTTFFCDDTGRPANVNNLFYKVTTNITGSASPANDPASTTTATGVQGTTLPPQPTSFTCPACTAGLSNSYNSIALAWSSPGGNAPVTNTISRGTSLTYSDTFTSPSSGFTATTFTNSAAAGNLPVYPSVTSYHYQLQVTNAGGTVTTADLPVTTPPAPWATSSGGLEGGWINTLVADPINAIIYGGSGKPTDATTAGGAFKSATAAAAWAPINNGIPNGRVITSMAARRLLSGAVQRLYAGTDGSGVLISVDNGLTWNQFGTGLSSATVTAVFVDAQKTVWAGTAAGTIFKLVNATTAWVSTTTPGSAPVQAFAEDTHAPDTLYAQAFGGDAASGGLLSIDPVAGTTWVQTNTGNTGGTPDCTLTRSNASALAIDASVTPAVLYWGSKSCGLLSRTVGVGGSTTWSVVNGFGPIATVPVSAEITRLVVDASLGLNIWAASAGNGVFYLKGASFVSMPNLSVTGWEPTALVFDGSSLEAGSADGSGVYQATNPTKPSGGQFSVFKAGMSNVSVKSLVNDPTDNTHLLAAGDQFGVAISTNQGGAWSPQTLPSQCGTVAGFVYNSHASPGIAFLLCQGVQGVFVGNLNGTSWTLQPCTGLPTPPTFSSGMAIQSGTPDTLYLATTTGTAATLFSTVASGATAGQTCTAFPTSLPADVTTATAIAVDTNGALYVGAPTIFPYTFLAGAGAIWKKPAVTGPKSVTSFFLNTHPSTPVMYAAGQDDSSGVGGVWSGPIGTVTVTTTVVWTAVLSAPVSGVTTASTVVGMGGLVTNANTPFVFAGLSFTAGQQYANVFRDTASTTAWSSSADGIIGGNVPALVLPDASNVSIGAAHVLSATTGAGVFKTTSGGQ